MSMELLDMLKNASEEEILTIITMSLEYYTRKYNRNINTTFSLIRKGMVELERMKEV